MTRLFVYHFGADAGFEGQLVGALERVEAEGPRRVLGVLFIARDDAGERFAVDLQGGRAGGLTASLLSFRLDVEERRRLTRRALRSARADLITSVGELLAPGDAIIALLVNEAPQDAFDDAVTRTGGRTLVSTVVTATSLSELAPAIVAALR